jgi:hypothetical protein
MMTAQQEVLPAMNSAMRIATDHAQEVLDIYAEAHARQASAYLVAPVRPLPAALADYTSNSQDARELQTRIALAACLLTSMTGGIVL